MASEIKEKSVCLSIGQRVLVTSKGEAALAVLRDHFPESIRELTISLLSNERECFMQLERAVTALSNNATHHDTGDIGRQITDIQSRIIKLRQQIEAIDAERHQWAEKHLKPIGGDVPATF